MQLAEQLNWTPDHNIGVDAYTILGKETGVDREDCRRGYISPAARSAADNTLKFKKSFKILSHPSDFFARLTGKPNTDRPRNLRRL